MYHSQIGKIILSLFHFKLDQKMIFRHWDLNLGSLDHRWHRTFTICGSIIVRLVPSLTDLNTIVLVHTNNNIFSCLVKSNPVELETSSTVIIHPRYSEYSLKCTRGVLGRPVDCSSAQPRCLKIILKHFWENDFGSSQHPRRRRRRLIPPGRLVGIKSSA